MYTRLTGILEEAGDGRAVVNTGAIAYEVLIPACDEAKLATMIGSEVTLHTLHYLEAQGQGATMLPRLIGFASRRDRAFFRLFTTVKGIGYRKALRALAVPFADVAVAIHNKDAAALCLLREVGKRTAETIVAELHGKVDDFLPPAGATRADTVVVLPADKIVDDAVAVLMQLGESRQRAETAVARAHRDLPPEAGTDELVTAALQLVAT